jgi:hypothetical protein
VARHGKKRTTHATDPAALKQRVQKALREKRLLQALDLARTLFKANDIPAHRDLLVQAAFARAEELLGARYARDAAAVLTAVNSLIEAPEDRKRLAGILARAGEFDLALETARGLGDSALLTVIAGHTADAAVQGRAVPPGGWPAEVVAQRELIVRAFAEVQASQDEQARTTLQGIGLTSPFLEWKVLLRGFLAYYQHDDARAVENWQRLNPERLPARLVAPFRLTIDSAFKAAQPLPTRELLLIALARTQGSAPMEQLRSIQRMLADVKQLGKALRQTETLLPALKADAPQMVRRLGDCLLWAVIDHGYPEDLQRYGRLFGPPGGDPTLDRAEALALEHRGQLEDAHAIWQQYEKALAAHAGDFPPGHADRTRALVWRHMADNARQMADDGDLDFADDPFDFEPPRKRKVKPDAETCYKRSLELAPDQVESHLALVRHYVDTEQPARALAAGKKLLKQFPDHVQTLELVGTLCLDQEKPTEAADYFNRAVQANPLDPRLRMLLCVGHAAVGEGAALAGEHDRAAEAFQAALALAQEAGRGAILCKWAACEFRARHNERAEELLQQARAAPGHPLAIAFTMLVGAIRLKLGKPLKSRFDGEFNDLLAQRPDPAGAAAVASHLAAMRQSGVKYTGQKTHETKLLAYLEKALRGEFTESQLIQICGALAELKAKKLLPKFFARGQRLFPDHPRFYLAEIEYLLEQPPYRMQFGKVQKLLQKARTLIAAKSSPERENLAQELKALEEMALAANPFLGLFGGSGFPGRSPFDFLGELPEDLDEDDEFDDDEF